MDVAGSAKQEIRVRFGRDDKGEGGYGLDHRSGERSPQISPLRSPGFPVETRGVEDLHTALSTESRTRGRRWQREAGNPGALRSR